MVEQGKKLSGAENILWDLSGLYNSIDDPQIDKDLDLYVQSVIEFNKKYKGALDNHLGDALRTLSQVTRLEYTLYRFPSLLIACDQFNEVARQLMSRVSETISAAAGRNITFFDIEVAKMKEIDYQSQLSADKDILKHKPMLDRIRLLAEFQLSEDSEQMISMLSPFGPDEWSDFNKEMEANLRITIDSESFTLVEALNLLSTSKDVHYRELVLSCINQSFDQQFITRYRARALNSVIGEKNTLDELRGYKNVMSSRNLSNMVADKTVDSLHQVVRSKGVEACKRFYRLLSKHLNEGEFKLLQWSDRNAPLPFADTSIIQWNDAVQLVESAYRSFSPKLADLVSKIIDSNWVDAPAYVGKSGGAFNASGPYIQGDFSYNLLNFKGTNRDVSTMAHELGHGVHGLLALESQGPLMWHAPMAYAETASIFGEMITFNYQLEACKTDELRLTLLMEKINDFINTVVRQISFSEFEQKIHQKRKHGKIKIEEFSAIWMETCSVYYGDNGEVFNFSEEMMNNLWCYIGHFMNPFYVYAYAFGELFTQGLYANRETVGSSFEQKYLELLRAGGTKDAVELLEPFGLNPNDPEFWETGMKASVFNWLEQAEEITENMFNRH